MLAADHFIRALDLSAAGVGESLDAFLTACAVGAGGGVLALLPEAETAAIPALQQACSARGLALAGGVFPALVEDAGFSQQGAWLLGFCAMPPFVLLDPADAPNGSLDRGIAEFVAAHIDNGSTTPLLFMLFDALLPDLCPVLRNLSERLERDDLDVLYAGCNVGSESFTPLPCLFDDQRTIQGGALVLLAPQAAGEIAVEHGCIAPMRLSTVTRSDNNRVIELDEEPAFDVYQRILKTDYAMEMDRDSFYQQAVHYPLMLMQKGVSPSIRIPVALDEDGALICVGEVPEGTLTALIQAPGTLEGSHCVERLGASLKGRVQGRLLTFYCAGRRLQFGVEAAQEELRMLAHQVGAHQVAGALSLGEIATDINDEPAFHSAVILCGAAGGETA
ncbi:FIST C-terminal domain-containing protein [Magnetofaba australis]|uniref:FIST C domain-containing protein n=1 Tax=Magnetofaba australis IT-1 TaxID=1434232 RepID=A0A1Y2K8K7_9PROT|nr:FIST C-terminal domain-containing protein [Magnetofaba australis]OSM06776.1 hypothetical protein MAIT1_00362 [Magnetofaba australis IT-1]